MASAPADGRSLGNVTTNANGGRGGRRAAVGALVGAAVRRRAALGLPAEGATNAFRVVDGAADGLDDTWIDAFADRWLVQTKGPRPAGDLVEACLRFAGSVWWKRLDRDAKAPPVLLAGERPPDAFEIVEEGARFRIDFSAGYSQGLFLDQRLNRHEVRARAGAAVPRPRILNLFAYTCGFSVTAALGGAVTTSLDLSQPYLDWGRANMELNGIDPDGHFFCRGDTLEWLERWTRSGRTFTGVIADPPTFSRNAKGRVWRVESDYPQLVERVLAVVEPGGWALFCTNFRGIAAADFEGLVRRAAGAAACRSTPMPPDFPGDPYLKSVWVEAGTR